MGSYHNSMTLLLFWVTLILFLALIGRYLATRIGQPGVLGELLMGVVVGNLGYACAIPLFVMLREGGSALFTLVQDMTRALPTESFFTKATALSSMASNMTALPSLPENAKQMMALLQTEEGPALLKVSDVLDAFSHFGVIFLLFMAGLESSLDELKQTGWESFRVACLGVLLPVTFGFGMAYAIMPTASYQSLLFVAATLAATSVGITARVLKDMNQLQTFEARTILGAAVIDDILGLILLAAISAFVTQGTLNLLLVGRIFLMAFLFFAVVFKLGPWLLQQMIRFFGLFLEDWEKKLFTSFIFLMLLAWLATCIHLDAIIGAFSAGLILHDGLFSNARVDVSQVASSQILQNTHHQCVEAPESSIRHLLRPLESVLAPLFFILIGIQVKLETFMNRQVLMIACGLLVAAIAGKLLAGMGGRRQDDRYIIGIGMLPRGEVGLIFASIGKTLQVIPDALFSALIVMIIVTTCITPLLLKARYTFRM